MPAYKIKRGKMSNFKCFEIWEDVKCTDKMIYIVRITMVSYDEFSNNWGTTALHFCEAYFFTKRILFFVNHIYTYHKTHFTLCT